MASLLAIFTVVLIITGSLEMAGLIVLSVSLVYLFLVALIPTTDIDFNHIVVVHLIASLGLSVLYSAQISYTYFYFDAPEELDVGKKRLWKVRVAMSRIGSSVFHGSLSTLLSVIIVGHYRQSYFFEVFFKIWLGIIFFGMANAFILIPILLACKGPTRDFEIVK